jgi:hypothetical protein
MTEEAQKATQPEDATTTRPTPSVSREDTKKSGDGGKAYGFGAGQG